MTTRKTTIVPKPASGTTGEKGFGPAATGAQGPAVQQNPSGTYSPTAGTNGSKGTRQR